MPSIGKFLRRVFRGEDFEPRDYRGHAVQTYLESVIVDTGYKQGLPPERVEVALRVHRGLNMPFP